MTTDAKVSEPPVTTTESLALNCSPPMYCNTTVDTDDRKGNQYSPETEDGSCAYNFTVPKYPIMDRSSLKVSHHSVASSPKASTIIEKPICRTCHDGDETEGLISPCFCRGTQGYLHRSCIERWLETTATNHCELCHYQFNTIRKSQPFAVWLFQPVFPKEHYNLIADIICFVLLTPLASLSSWLCINGSQHYRLLKGGHCFESVGLVTLTTILIAIYLLWLMVSVRYHYRMWYEWSSSNYNIKVLDSLPTRKVPNTQRKMKSFVQSETNLVYVNELKETLKVSKTPTLLDRSSSSTTTAKSRPPPPNTIPG